MGNVLGNFENWKEFLGEHVEHAESMGLDDEQIANVAHKMGEFLADRVDPKNDQQRLLKQMWDCGSDDERHAMASLMVKLSHQERTH